MKKFKNYIKKNKKLLIISIGIILFILLGFMIFNNYINNIDNDISLKLIEYRNDILNNIMIIITNISSAYSLIVLTFLLLIFIKKKKYVLYIGINLACAFLTNQVFKLIMQRPRPEGINLIDAEGFSYPSGHSFVVMAYFGFITYLICRLIKNKYIKYGIITLSSIIILFVGFSRIYLGVHYLSDVIAGFILSLVYLNIYISIVKEKI